MADNSRIEWCDATLNYVNGCSLESPGCTHCYAMKQAHRFDVRRGLTVKTKGGMVWTGEVRENEKARRQALSWRRGRRIFWNAHGDLFHPSVPDAWIDRQFAVCALTPQHTHMILTKRSKRMREYFADPETDRRIGVLQREMEPLATCYECVDQDASWPLPNVWLGVSVEDQTRADERIPDLLATPAAVRFLSCEPLLGPVDLTRVHRFPSGMADKEFINAIAGKMWTDQSGLPNPDPRWSFPGISFADGERGLDWVICGGESGPGARPMHPAWARSLRDQCQADGVPFFFKQWGEWLPVAGWPSFRCAWASPINDRCEQRSLDEWVRVWRVGKKAAGRLLDGREWNEVPTAPAIPEDAREGAGA